MTRTDTNIGAQTPRHAATALTKKDFERDQEVRWCPGCGDYAILAQVQKLMPELGIPRHNIVFISGIGCSSRFPYYMNTYGMHSIHGRAPAFATGLKVARPELSVWVVTGDGDGLSIGGNHTDAHAAPQRGPKILLFNNRIYGLTKGQYSPTSELGKKTKSTPYGSVDRPFARPRRAGRGRDLRRAHRRRRPQLLSDVLRRAAAHKGTAFVEIYQNCNVFNDGGSSSNHRQGGKADAELLVEHGKPWVFGKAKDKGIRIGAVLRPEVFEVGTGPGEVPVEACLVHDEGNEALAHALARLGGPDMPTRDRDPPRGA